MRINSKIQIQGKNNSIYIDKQAIVKDSLLRIAGNDSIIHIHSDCTISGAELWIEDNGCKIEIHNNSFIGSRSHLACTEDNSTIFVGEDCMVSSQVQIRTGDSHSIMDMQGERINRAQSVFIGNHCWLGQGSRVLKGVHLENDVVVSTGAIVTKSFNSNSLIGGVPARIIKENIIWDKERL